MNPAGMAQPQPDKTEPSDLRMSRFEPNTLDFNAKQRQTAASTSGRLFKVEQHELPPLPNIPFPNPTTFPSPSPPLPTWTAFPNPPILLSKSEHPPSFRVTAWHAAWGFTAGDLCAGEGFVGRVGMM
ncbi:hypothetical protein QJS04_geneDACA012395 [Acorus gramineus]|uniref:Uncharacterized protein n=1 Tax=Acorus gramineus TaxID=55184 RepID=A0AAV9B8X6_ACOGR|nr:hypothetical protein QJS04_geneDACA012395 [Acorus gramineus]